MKLASLASNSPDGRLFVVSSDHSQCCSAEHIAPNMLQAIEQWATIHNDLEALAFLLEEGKAPNQMPFNLENTTAPLPRTWQWLDGSAFPQHGYLMQKAYNHDPIEYDKPLMYQGLSDKFYGPFEDVPFVSENDGIDFEGEFAVVVDHVPMGTCADDAMAHIKLILQLNDWSLRNIAISEMKTGFGWVNGKPACSVAGVAITPNELGSAWVEGRVGLPLHIRVNGVRFGDAHGDEMAYGFHELVAHAAATRSLPAGTIIGSGTVSNKEYKKVGSSCLSERRAIDMIEFGEIKTPFLSFNDNVFMETRGSNEQPLFGPIKNNIIEYKR